MRKQRRRDSGRKEGTMVAATCWHAVRPSPDRERRALEAHGVVPLWASDFSGAARHAAPSYPPAARGSLSPACCARSGRPIGSQRRLCPGLTHLGRGESGDRGSPLLAGFRKNSGGSRRWRRDLEPVSLAAGHPSGGLRCRKRIPPSGHFPFPLPRVSRKSRETETRDQEPAMATP